MGKPLQQGRFSCVWGGGQAVADRFVGPSDGDGQVDMAGDREDFRARLIETFSNTTMPTWASLA